MGCELGRDAAGMRSAWSAGPSALDPAPARACASARSRFPNAAAASAKKEIGSSPYW